jgi:hypothetical protein
VGGEQSPLVQVGGEQSPLVQVGTSVVSARQITFGEKKAKKQKTIMHNTILDTFLTISPSGIILTTIMRQGS